jgi:hypothetical protein
MDLVRGGTIALDINLRVPRIAPAWRARVRNTLFYRFYTAPCGAPRTTPADFGISINLLLAARAGRPHASIESSLHAIIELAKRKGCEICVWY